MVHFASWTHVFSPPARQGLTGQRDGATGGRLVFRRLPACHLQWLLPTCRPGKHRSEPSGGKEALEARSLSLPAGRGVCADGPEPTLPRTPSPLPKLTKEQPCWDRPPGSFWEAQLDSVRPDAPSPLAGTERSQCSQRVGTQWALPGPECFHQHQLIPIGPHPSREPGAAERERAIIVPIPRT